MGVCCCAGLAGRAEGTKAGCWQQGREAAGAMWEWSRCREHLAMPLGWQPVEDFEGGAHLDFGLEGLFGCQVDSRFRGGRVEISQTVGERRKRAGNW